MLILLPSKITVQDLEKSKFTGLVLMRVPDPDVPGETKLDVVEYRCLSQNKDGNVEIFD